MHSERTDKDEEASEGTVTNKYIINCGCLLWVETYAHLMAQLEEAIETLPLQMSEFNR